MNKAQLLVALVAVAVFFAMVACFEGGYREGRRPSEEPELAHKGTGTIEAAVFALLGLLLGFSFAVSISRLDARRELIVAEANAIGTAYLRVDLLAKGQPEMRKLFREYLDSRLRVYETARQLGNVDQEAARSAQIQQRIWSLAVNASRWDPTPVAAMLLLPALNTMIDITTSRKVALYAHVPGLIFGLLICIALLSALLAGYSMAVRRSRSWLHILVYSLVIAATVYAVIDLDYPRGGLIRLDAADAAVANVRELMR
jgi:formate hydrogenlyase subunit 3/multisubunit Na+/H+ antiporter MnhD subunit